MIKYLLICLIVPFGLFSETGWFKLNFPISSHLVALSFYDENNGVVIGDSTIYITQDGGVNWKNIIVNLNDTLYKTLFFRTVAYPSLNKIIIGGSFIDPSININLNESPIILTYLIDANQFNINNLRKNNLSHEYTEGIRLIKFNNERVGYLIFYPSTDEGNILKTTNGGETWQQHFIGKGFSEFDDIDVNKDSLFIIGGTIGDAMTANYNFSLIKSKDTIIKNIYPSKSNSADNTVVFNMGNNSWLYFAYSILITYNNGFIWQEISNFDIYKILYDRPHYGFSSSNLSFYDEGKGYFSFSDTLDSNFLSKIQIFKVIDFGKTIYRTKLLYDLKSRAILKAINDKVAYAIAQTNDSTYEVWKTEDGGGVADDVETETTIYNSFSIFPNPTNDFIYIKSNPLDPDRIYIYSLLGEEVMNIDFTNKVDISGLISGIYILKMGSSVFKIIKL